MKLPAFKSKQFLSQNPSADRLKLCESSIESLSLRALLQMADEETRDYWDTLSMGYSDAQGLPLLREEICLSYDSLKPEQLVVCAGAEEAIFITLQVTLRRGDHVIVITPCHQSFLTLPAFLGAEITRFPLDPRQNWALDLKGLRKIVRPNTRLILVSFPHNPTGALLNEEQFKELIEIAERFQTYLFSDESARYMEHDPADRLPAAVDLYERALSIGTLSKVFGLGGLRIGWVASHAADLIENIRLFKDYGSACNSSPSEVLGLIALRNRERLLVRTQTLLRQNLEVANAFFSRHEELFTWIAPKGGAVAFPRLNPRVDIVRFCKTLLKDEGVLLMPGSAFDYAGNYFRFGFGRSHFPEALALLEEFIQR